MRCRKSLQAHADGPVYPALAPFADDRHDVPAFQRREIIDMKCQLSAVTLDPESQGAWRKLPCSHGHFREYNAVALDDELNVPPTFAHGLHGLRRVRLADGGGRDGTQGELVA